jgi:DNA-binding Lrp family transcriptional regulator
LDKLDVSLIREFSQARETLPAKVGLRSSYRQIARKLRVSPGTVRDRIAKMYAAGVLNGASVYVNPSLLALKGAAYAVEVSPDRPKEDVIRELRSMDDLLFIHNFRGNFLGIFFVYTDESTLQGKLASFDKLAGSGSSGALSHVFFPPCSAHLTVADWKLIARLTEQPPFDSYADLARDLRVSVRTLKRRMSRILDQGALLSSPRLDYRAITGGLPVDLVVHFSEAEARQEAARKILRLVEDYLLFIGPGVEYIVFNLVTPKISLATELAESARQVNGVKFARAELVDEHIDLTGSFAANHIRRRLAGTSRAPIGALIT